MRTFVRVAALQASLILLAFPKVLAAQTPEAGFVVSMEGEWFSSARSEPLEIGQVLSDQERVWASRHRSLDQSLTIVLYAGGWIELRCADRGTCNRRHVIRGGRSSSGWIRNTLAAVAGLVREGPLRYVPVITRRGVPLREAVLDAGAGGVDLAPALAGVPASELRLEAAPLDSAFSTGDWVSLRVSWAPGSPALVPREALPPGPLIAIRQRDEPDTEAWVLVDHGGTGVAMFDELVAALHASPGESDPEAVRTVLRAVLHQLALQGAADEGGP